MGTDDDRPNRVRNAWHEPRYANTSTGQFDVVYDGDATASPCAYRPIGRLSWATRCERGRPSRSTSSSLAQASIACTLRPGAANPHDERDRRGRPAWDGRPRTARRSPATDLPERAQIGWSARRPAYADTTVADRRSTPAVGVDSADTSRRRALPATRDEAVAPTPLTATAACSGGVDPPGMQRTTTSASPATGSTGGSQIDSVGDTTLTYSDTTSPDVSPSTPSRQSTRPATNRCRATVRVRHSATSLRRPRLE